MFKKKVAPCSNKTIAEEWEDVDEEEDDDMEEDDEEEETMDQEEEDPAAQSDPQPAALLGSIPVTDCLFCSHHSKSLLKNVAHMTKVHSFFLPDVEFLVDLKGLIRYLGEFGVKGLMWNASSLQWVDLKVFFCSTIQLPVNLYVRYLQCVLQILILLLIFIIYSYYIEFHLIIGRFEINPTESTLLLIIMFSCLCR